MVTLIALAPSAAVELSIAELQCPRPESRGAYGNPLAMAQRFAARFVEAHLLVEMPVDNVWWRTQNHNLRLTAPPRKLDWLDVSSLMPTSASQRQGLHLITLDWLM